MSTDAAFWRDRDAKEFAQRCARYQHKDYMQGVEFLRFPKPWVDLEKCKRWVNACKRSGFSTDNVKKDTYICNKHFIGGRGPTDDHPDPVPATATTIDVSYTVLIISLIFLSGRSNLYYQNNKSKRVLKNYYAV